MKSRILAAPAFADTFGSDANTFTMDFVTIGNAENAPDDTGYGRVDYTYRMGVNEVSRGMINAYNALIPGHGGLQRTARPGRHHERGRTECVWHDGAERQRVGVG